MRKFIAFFVLWFLTIQFAYCQCENNIIKNGSFELDSVGIDVVGMYWVKEGSPDIESASDQFFISGNSMWSDSVLSSTDGGNWQNIARRVTFSGAISFESIGQEITLFKSVPHLLEFEFTAQSRIPSFPGTGYAAIDVFIDNELFYTTEIDTILFEWEKIAIQFTPIKKDFFIQFKINPSLAVEPGKSKYVAIDGICIRPIQMGMFCDP